MMAGSSQHQPSQGRRGFTLIELLVVISIIALLVSILLPALQRARAAAKTAVCLSNLRQLNLACTMYVDDYRFYPPIVAVRDWVEEGEDPRPVQVPWMNLMEKYLPGQAGWVGGQNRFLICPEAPRFIGSWYGNCSYGYNVKSFAYGRGTSWERINPGAYVGLAVVTPEHVRRPSDKVVFGDGAFGAYEVSVEYAHATYAIDCIDMGLAAQYGYLAALDLAPTMRHSKGPSRSDPLAGRDDDMMGRACLGYADGHAQADGTEYRLQEYQQHWPIW